MKSVTIFFAIALIWLGLTAGAQAACGVGVAGTTQRVTVGTTGRSVLVHVPANTGGSPSPVIFLFHGSGGSGASMLENSRLETTADAHGFIVVAPDGGIPVDGGFVWNIPGVPTVTGKVPGPEDANDVAFVGATMDWLTAQGCADPHHLYAAGFSGGGRMTSWLGCVAADRFAAIAPVVGLRAGNPLKRDPKRPDPATCQPSRPMPLIAFAGDKDTTNPIEGGGAGYWQYTMHAAEQRWAKLNGCRAAETTRWVAPDIYEEAYTACRNGADVVGRITVGGTHRWLADNEAMWAFLSRHSR